jgi:hypothetical protein
MSTPSLVIDFYERIWNAGNQLAVAELLSEDFLFRGSLGAELRGQTAFWDYVCGVRSALGDYRCDILQCVSEGQYAFAILAECSKPQSVLRPKLTLIDREHPER